MSKPTEKSTQKPSAPAAEKPLTGAALDRALKAGTAPQWDDQGRKAPAPSKIRWMPKRGKK